MKKKLVSGLEFVGIGGECTTCVLIITQHTVANEPTNQLLAEALEVYALGDSFEEVLSKCHGLSSLACACYHITKSSTNFSTNSSAFRCLVGVVVHNAHGY
jgi:ferredoxin